jgi:hypothetical protein
VSASRGVPNSGRRARYLGALSLVAACAALLAIPGGASASTVHCTGDLLLGSKSDAGVRGVRYRVKCSEDVLAFSIHTSHRIDYFTPDPVVLKPNGDPSDDDRFVCEGPIPGPGFGCPGAMTAGNRVVGWFSTVGSRCNPIIRAWVVVTTEQLSGSGTPFITSSHPFGLPPPATGCPPSGQSRPASAGFLGLGSLFGQILT